MAFSLRNLSVLAYANGFTLWHYKAGADGLIEANNTGYFADAADLMAAGDMVMLTGAEGGKIATVAGEGREMRLAALV
jgi:outer membrane protein assembly factor BamB